jgi:hypothetical protein
VLSLSNVERLLRPNVSRCFSNLVRPKGFVNESAG